MPYKDKAKQKEANKKAKARFIAKQAEKNAPGLARIDDLSAEGIPEQGILEGIPAQDRIPNVEPVESDVIPKARPTGLPANFGQADCQCQHCQNVRAHGSHIKLNHGPRKMIDELAPNEINRVSLPGDVDYDGIVQDAGDTMQQPVNKV